MQDLLCKGDNSKSQKIILGGVVKIGSIASSSLTNWDDCLRLRTTGDFSPISDPPPISTEPSNEEESFDVGGEAIADGDLYNPAVFNFENTERSTIDSSGRKDPTICTNAHSIGTEGV